MDQIIYYDMITVSESESTNISISTCESTVDTEIIQYDEDIELLDNQSTSTDT